MRGGPSIAKHLLGTFYRWHGRDTRGRKHFEVLCKKHSKNECKSHCFKLMFFDAQNRQEPVLCFDGVTPQKNDTDSGDDDAREQSHSLPLVELPLPLFPLEKSHADGCLEGQGMGQQVVNPNGCIPQPEKDGKRRKNPARMGKCWMLAMWNRPR